MKIIRIFVLTAVLTFACASRASAESWRGLVPLRSNRADVEKLLGAPQSGSRSIYKTPTEIVSATYAETTCAYGWKVPINTLISLIVTPLNSPKLSDVRLDDSKFEKRRDVHLENVYYYVNSHDGINWTIDTGLGTVSSVEYYPDDREGRLKCALVTPKPTASPNKPVVIPAKNKRRRKRRAAPAVAQPKTKSTKAASSSQPFTHEWHYGDKSFLQRRAIEVSVANFQVPFSW